MVGAGGTAVRQRRSSGDPELSLQFAREWAALCVCWEELGRPEISLEKQRILSVEDFHRSTRWRTKSRTNSRDIRSFIVKLHF